MAVLDDEAFGAATDVVPQLFRRPIRQRDGSEPMVGSSCILIYYLIDVDNAIIVDVEATTAIRQAEVRLKTHDRTLDQSL